MVANEFFDALPVHQFEKTADGWRERLIDISRGASDAYPLRLTLAKEPTAALQAVESMLRSPAHKVGAVVEVSFDALEAAAAASRLVAGGGAGLVIDYGDIKTGDTLRAFRAHKQVHIFDQPGSADLTCDVNFLLLRRALSAAGASVYGPVNQGDFLRALHIESRAHALGKANPAAAPAVAAAVRMLTHDMGERFKMLAFTAPGLPTPPFGFAPG